MKNENKVGLAQARAKSIALAATVFLVPALLLITIFIIYPVIDTFVISGYKWNGISSDRIFAGMENWKALIHDEMFWKSFKHNLIVMVFSIVLQIPIGMLLATFLDAGGKKFNIFKIIWFLPYLMSSVAIAFLFNYALATNGGIISSFASLIQGKKATVDLLGTAPNALYTVIGVMAWQFTPFYMVYFIAGYGNIDTSIYEAAVIDGATRWQQVRYVTLPNLRTMIAILLIMNISKIFNSDFGLFWNVPQASGSILDVTQTIDTYVYRSLAATGGNLGMTTAAGVFQNVVGFGCMLVANTIVKRIFHLDSAGVFREAVICSLIKLQLQHCTIT